MGDLSSRRGMVQGMDDVLGGKIIKAEVPLSEMFGYSDDAAFSYARPRNVFDGVQALLGSTEERCRSRYQGKSWLICNPMATDRSGRFEQFKETRSWQRQSLSVQSRT